MGKFRSSYKDGKIKAISASCKIAEARGFSACVKALAVGPAHPRKYHVLSQNTA